MHQREQEKCARERRKAEALGDIASEIHGARDLVRAGWLASQQIDGDDAAAVAEVLETVAKRLTDIAERTERASRPEGATDAA